jgi:hypothetical protein
MDPAIAGEPVVASMLEVRAMDPELELIGAVEEWATRQTAGDEDLAARAAAVALHSYASGASASEAFRQARTFVRSWRHHPSRVSPGRPVRGSRRAMSLLS